MTLSEYGSETSLLTKSCIHMFFLTRIIIYICIARLDFVPDFETFEQPCRCLS